MVPQAMRSSAALPLHLRPVQTTKQGVKLNSFQTHKSWPFDLDCCLFFKRRGWKGSVKMGNFAWFLPLVPWNPPQGALCSTHWGKMGVFFSAPSSSRCEPNETRHLWKADSPYLRMWLGGDKAIREITTSPWGCPCAANQPDGCS